MADENNTTSVIDTLIYDRTAEDVAARNAKAFLNYTDLNRIEEAVQYIADRIIGIGGYIDVGDPVVWLRDTQVTHERIDRLLLAVWDIYNSGYRLASTPAPPNNMDNLTYEDVNHIEEVLFDANTFVEYRKMVYIESGMSRTAMSGYAIYIPTNGIYKPVVPIYVVTVIGGIGSGSYKVGDVVTITAETLSGNEFIGWTGNVELVDASAETTTFIMPADYVTVTANYESIIHEIIVTSDSGGSASASAQTAERGSTITLMQSADLGYAFTEWVVLAGDINIVNDQFIMPNTDVSIKAAFAYIFVSVPVPRALTYTGATLTPTWTGYDTNKMTISGDTSGQLAGAYEAVFTLVSGYKWEDNTTEPKMVQWTISKATPSAVVLSKSSISLDNHTHTDTFTVRRDGNGQITATSSNTNVCTVSVSNNVLTVTSVNNTSGTATITVSVAEGDNYLAPANVTCDVSAVFIPEYIVSASTSPASTGTISGTGTYVSGETATLTATGTGYYRLDHWELNGTTVSTANPYTFTVNSDVTVTAVMTSVPSGYTVLSYVYNTGAVQCPLGIAFTSDSVVTVSAMVTGWYPTSSTSAYRVFMMAKHSTSWGYLVRTTGSKTTFTLGNGYGTGSDAITTVPYDFTTSKLRFVVDYSNYKLSVNHATRDVEYSNTRALNGGNPFDDIAVPYYATTAAYTKANVYEVTAKYASTGEVYADLLPAKRDSDNVVGYYDVIGRRFIAPTSGKLLAGT